MFSARLINLSPANLLLLLAQKRPLRNGWPAGRKEG